MAGLHFDNWQAVLTDFFYRDILLKTLRIAAVTTFFCALLGYVPAYFIAMTRMKNRTVLLILLMLPFWISYIIRTMSWINILGVSGALNKVLLGLGLISEPVRLLYSEGAVVLGLVHYLLPFMILNVYVSLDGIDRNLIDAGQSLGANAWQTFWEVTFPLSLPGSGRRQPAVFRAGRRHLHHAADPRRADRRDVRQPDLRVRDHPDSIGPWARPWR